MLACSGGVAVTTITIKGIDDAARALGVDVPGIVDPVMERAAMRMQARLMTYPPPPSGSTYRRTGTLGRRWTVEGGNMRWVVGNNTRYARDVEGDLQTKVHKRTGWPTAEQVALDEEPDLVRNIETALSQKMSG